MNPLLYGEQPITMLLRGLRVGGRLSYGPSSRIFPATAPLFRYYSKKHDPFPINYKEAQEQKKVEDLPKWRQWALYTKSKEFQKSMTVYYLGGFGVMCVTFYYYMRDRYHEDKQIRMIKKKYSEDVNSLSEYEYLKLKALSGENLKPREAKKFKIYQMMRKEFRRKHFFDTEAVFEPTPEELDEWYNKQYRRTVTKAPVAEDRESLAENSKLKDTTPKEVEVAPEELTNSNNPKIVKAEDTTEFFNDIADEYDDEIKWEERGVMMGRRRKWLMKQARGDVLEVACGTGRNIPYLNTETIDSITFLDSSSKMVEKTQQKFRAKYPKYAKAAFAVGKAEDLVKLAANSEHPVKYDTIIEAFGLCAHEDPIKALKNMTQLLKPGGRIVLLEHGRSTWDFINNHLDFRADKRMKTWGCRWNLEIGEIIDDAGLDITYEKRVHLGTTWLLVCKRPEDPMALEEKPFINKLFGSDITRVEKR